MSRLSKLFFLSILFFTAEDLNAAPHVSEHGVRLASIILSKVNSDPVVSLSGEWEFYWHQLLTPEDFKNKSRLSPQYLKVPGSWHNQGNPLLGCGTYRVRIIFQKKLIQGY